MPFEAVDNRFSRRRHGGICRELSAHLKLELQTALVALAFGLGTEDGRATEEELEVMEESCMCRRWP